MRPDADTEALPIVDAHHHFWDLGRNVYPWLQDTQPIPFRYGDYSAIRRNYLPADYERDIAGLPVVKSIHMEAEIDRSTPVAETQWLTAIAQATGRPNACIGHARLEAADAAEVLAGHAACALARGIRQKPAAASAPSSARRGEAGSMDDEQWRRGYALLSRHGFSFDLQTPWWHLDAAAELAGDFPDTPIILNHTGLPADRSEDGLAGWRRAMARFAAMPNAAVKLSGLGLPGGVWRREQNIGLLREAIAIFGADRCMFASNFPVDSLVASYGEIVDAMRSAIAVLPLEDRRKILHDNAVRFYRL